MQSKCACMVMNQLYKPCDVVQRACEGSRIILTHIRLKHDFKCLVRSGRLVTPSEDGDGYIVLTEIELERESEVWACKFGVSSQSSGSQGLNDLGG